MDEPRPRELKNREWFESFYNDGDLSQILRMGRFPIECHERDCEEGYEPRCHGWKMVSAEFLEDCLVLYGNSQAEVDEALKHRDQLLEQYGIEKHSVRNYDGVYDD